VWLTNFKNNFKKSLSVLWVLSSILDVKKVNKKVKQKKQLNEIHFLMLIKKLIKNLNKIKEDPNLLFILFLFHDAVKK
jgi:hypothetical protein